MLDQSGHLPSMSGGIPLGRGLMPEELADFKAKGREWSRLYKEKRRKDFSLEQIEERKLKNRCHPLTSIPSRPCFFFSEAVSILKPYSIRHFMRQLGVCDL